MSSVVDPRGRVRQRTSLFRPAALTGLVETTDVRTVFTRVGDVAGGGATLLTLLLLAGTLLPGREPVRSPGREPARRGSRDGP
ncbi:MAG: hypothetical protein GWM92_12375 [Gemmatimonadetes bacterium]|nr:hypothetical protein [Gemmatimonadota bacterium]NIT88174.1 hypothetical protein [Gemmatimonadota bacterium]NIU31981.1 hypothetical protein [Gemmatimonadota bacterium]NIV62357.1 hypothetical protein [Gemmatimonadota bacterium]NIV83492.1 hypothetical protein [Gemmatimonadota bacterium]